MVFFLAHNVKCKYPNESEMVQREARTDGPTRELASTHLLPTMMIVNNTIFQIEERQRLIVTLSWGKSFIQVKNSGYDRI